MPMVGGMDIHRKQITFDYLDTVTGEVRRGQIAPADREHLAAWLAGRFTGQAADFAVEGCTGWRSVAEELAAAGITPYYASVKERIDGKRAAISEARKIIRQSVHVLSELGDDALTTDLSPSR